MQRIHGVVTNVSPAGIGVCHPKSEFRVVRTLLWTLATVAILPGVVAFWIMRDLMSSGRRPHSGPGLLQQIFGYWLGIKLWNRSQTPVRNFRVRESGSGRTRLVRMFGNLIEGDVAMGDTVTVFGDDSNGTLIFRDGMNHSLRSRIAVR